MRLKSLTCALNVVAVVSTVSPAAASPATATAPCTRLPITLRVSPSNAGQVPHNAVAVASLNMAGRSDIGDELAAWTQQHAFDILLLQEVGGRSVDGAAFVAALSQRLAFHSAYAPAAVLEEGTTDGLAILSRDPIEDVSVEVLTHYKLRFRSRCRIALAATVTTAAGPLRVINVHLDTRINSGDRIAQLAPVLENLDSDHRPQIIGGDFNTMNIGWFRSMWPFPFAQHQGKAVGMLLSGRGFHTPFHGTPPTFRFLGLPFRLDWLYLKNLEALDRRVESVRLSDHRGIWALVSRDAGRSQADTRPAIRVSR